MSVQSLGSPDTWSKLPPRRSRVIDRFAAVAVSRRLASIIVLGLLFVAFGFAFRSAGRWLVVEDTPQFARAVVVFGGHVPFRAMEAAAIYKQGWAPEVWLTQSGVHAEDLALQQLGIERPLEHEYSRLALRRSGVPQDAIRVLAERTENTAEEVRAVSQRLELAGGGRVILITSKYHTRRVKALWRTLVKDLPEPIVRYAPGDPFDPDGWWRRTGDAESVAHEWFGLLNAWAGFPLQPARP